MMMYQDSIPGTNAVPCRSNRNMLVSLDWSRRQVKYQMVGHVSHSVKPDRWVDEQVKRKDSGVKFVGPSSMPVVPHNLMDQSVQQFIDEFISGNAARLNDITKGKIAVVDQLNSRYGLMLASNMPTGLT